MPLNTKTGSPMSATAAASRRTSRPGRSVGSTRPRWRLVATLLDRMPPSDPAELTNAGSRTRSAGSAAKIASCFSTARPASVDSTSAAAMTGSDSRKI